MFVLHTTDVTKAEVRRQIQELATELANGFNKANKNFRLWNNRFRQRPQGEVRDLNADELAGQAISEFEYVMLMQWRPQVHSAMELPAKPIFERYFRRDAPFDQADSKEFPDAFVIEALDGWCRTRHERMYVVTQDAAMRRAAEATDSLLPLAKLDDLMQISAEVESPHIVEQVEKMLEDSSFLATLEEMVREHIGRIGVSYSGDWAEGEAVDHSLDGSPEVLGFSVLSASENEIELIVKLEVPLLVEVQYEDRSEAMYDKEDDIWFGAENVSTEIRDAVTVRSYMAVSRADNSMTDFEILTPDVYVSEPYEDYK